MTWVKIDEHTFRDDKIKRVSPASGWFWIAALCHCNQELTDGKLQSGDLLMIQGMSHTSQLDPVVSELESLDMLQRDDENDCWWVVNYAKYQPTKNLVVAQRAANARRQALFRDTSLQCAIKTRDRDSCRYCGKRVAWADRKSPSGATYDHVDPSGGNTFLNLVVACRACNSSKGSRTPEQAGMTLLPPPDPTVPDPGERNQLGNQLQVTERVTANGLHLPERQNGKSSFVTPEALAEMRQRRRASA